MENKKCSTCNINKPLSEYHRWKYGPDGYRRVCKECRKLETKKYYELHGDKIRASNTKYRIENPDKVKEVKQRIYERDKERILKVNKLYRENNRDKRNEYVRNRKKNDPIFKLKHTMNNRLLLFLKVKSITKKNKTFEIVGCTPEKLKSHLESQFVNGMSWDNMGQWHIDHIIPLSSVNTEEEILKLCHYSNLQPLWAIDNMKKGSKLPSQLNHL